MTDLFTTGATNAPAPEETDPDTQVEAVIGTLKAKFTKDGQLDVDALLKSRAYAELHIKTVEGEARSIRDELNTRLSYEQFLDEIKSSRSASNPPQPSEMNEPSEQVGVKKDELEKLVKDTIRNERSQTQKEANRARVADELRKVWGNNFQSKLAAKADELNLSREFMTSVAETNPQAFLKMVEATPQAHQHAPNTAPPQTSVRPGTGPANVRNNKHYTELRRKDLRTYMLPHVQIQMHKDALEQGEDFFR